MEGVFELADLEMRLLQDGSPPPTNSVERLIRLWRLYLHTESSMNAARLELKGLQEAHEKENAEFRKKFDQTQALASQQDSISMKTAEENQQLHDQLKQQHLEKEAQKMEVAQLLNQGGLEKIVLLSPSKQVAYLLAERTSLLEKLQSLEVHEAKKCPALPERPPHTDLEPVVIFKDGMDKSSGSEPSEDGSVERLHLDRDLEDAHKRIHRLTDKLESARMTQKAYDEELQCARQEVKLVRQEAEKLRLFDVAELRKATELNERLETEIKILRDSEHVAPLAMAEIAVQTVTDDVDSAHLRCLKDLREKDLELCELQACMLELQYDCDQLQLQKDQLQRLLEEQKQNHSSTVEALEKELECLMTMVNEESQTTLVDDYKALAKKQSEECVKMGELVEVMRSLLHTARGEVLSGIEKNAKLENLSTELDYKNQEVLADLQEALARVSELEQKGMAQSAELQKLLEKNTQLQDDLYQEQKLCRQNQQAFKELQVQHLMEKGQRYAKEKEIFDLQQQFKSKSERLIAAENKLQTSSIDMKDKLHASQNEVLALQEELKRTLREMDKQLNTYNKKNCRLKDRLSSAKLFHIKEIRLRDDKIQELQRKCDLLTKKVDKVTELTKTMDEVNTNLLMEKRQFQCQLLKSHFQT